MLLQRAQESLPATIANWTSSLTLSLVWRNTWIGWDTTLGFSSGWVELSEPPWIITTFMKRPQIIPTFSLVWTPGLPATQIYSLCSWGLFELTQRPSRALNLTSCVVSQNTGNQMDTINCVARGMKNGKMQHHHKSLFLPFPLFLMCVCSNFAKLSWVQQWHHPTRRRKIVSKSDQFTNWNGSIPSKWVRFSLIQIIRRKKKKYPKASSQVS